MTGQVPAGYRLAATTAAPSTLRIAGSEGRVAAITGVETDPIDVEGTYRNPPSGG